MRFFASLVLALFLISACQFAQAFELEFPIACNLGKDCWVQQYADHGGGAAPKDYKCQGETYHGHDGTDFRVLNTKSDIRVLASAGGTIKAIRDGVEDKLANKPELLRAVIRQECGNGIVIAHEGGYETQYCHMRNGSIGVKVGESVKAGDPLGKVGYSGAAAFPHLHLSLRRGSVKLDPFGGELLEACGISGANFWSSATRQKLSYRDSELLELGWSEKALNLADLELGPSNTPRPEHNWPAIVVYGRAINLRKGDVLKLELFGARGPLAKNEQQLQTDKAEYVISVGKKAVGGQLPGGPYRGQLKIVRKDIQILEGEIESPLN